MGLLDEEEIPQGLGMALAQNQRAMQNFSALGETERREIITQARRVNSRQEMRRLADGLAERFTG